MLNRTKFILLKGSVQREKDSRKEQLKYMFRGDELGQIFISLPELIVPKIIYAVLELLIS